MWETVSASFKFDFLANIFPEQESVYRNPILGNGYSTWVGIPKKECVKK